MYVFIFIHANRHIYRCRFIRIWVQGEQTYAQTHKQTRTHAHAQTHSKKNAQNITETHTQGALAWVRATTSHAYTSFVLPHSSFVIYVYVVACNWMENRILSMVSSSPFFLLLSPYFAFVLLEGGEEESKEEWEEGEGRRGGDWVGVGDRRDEEIKMGEKKKKQTKGRRRRDIKKYEEDEK